ncbi:MAG: DNA mismatch repair protein MutS [Alphaproteobacteria bacterium HGW-Alphaproteobacteria-18]|nr:MAG: DNA mismatch repair protein MutS [Alphaproteobacteria bacterium HGW-Alphaproteobacteria-18]
MKGRRLSEEETRAWAKVAATVKRIGPQEASLPDFQAALEAGEAELRETRPAKKSASQVKAPSPAVPPQPIPPADRGREKRVRRGKLDIASTFDLHGHTQLSAARALPAFLMSQQADGARCVLIITGKGREGQGVLRRNFLIWLESPEARALVSGYAESHPKHGGSGAFYVFLRRRD